MELCNSKAGYTPSFHRCLKTVMDLGQILGGLDILRLVIFSARDVWTLYSDVISSYHPNICLLFAFLTK